jgi:sn-glycerol 3-phosphate transport system permease protein
VLVVFTHYPILATLIDSVYSTAKPRRPSHFVGSENYDAMLADPVFWKAMTNNLIYAAATIPLSVMLALAMAMIVNGRIPGRGLLRMAFFTPTVLPMIAVANIWLFFFTPTYGGIDQMLALFGVHGTNWLGSKETALGCVIIVAVWKEAGFFMIFYLAALQTIPPDLIEAARVEGASRWQILRRITLPLLAPTTLFVAINAVINAFRTVDHIFALTSGGPDNATTVLMYQIYLVGFSFFDQGYASAMTVVLLVGLGAIALGQFLLFDRRVHYR